MRKFRRIGSGILVAAVLGVTVPGCGDNTASDPPQILGITPDDGSIAVPVNANVIVTFNLPMDETTVEETANFTLLKESDSFSPPGSLTYNTSTFTAVFDPTLDLEPETLYRVTLTRDIRGEDGERLIREYTWTFRTGLGPLVVTTTRPLEGAVNVPVNGNVTVTFNETMDAATITTTTVKLEGLGGAEISGSVSYNEATRTMTFDPASNLQTETTYLVRLTTGITDAGGNPLVQEMTFSFMTGADFPEDDIFPVFAGATSAVAAGSDAITLSWTGTAATDNQSPQSGIVYFVYRATTSDAQNFANPTYVTGPGVTSYTATGLTAGTTYYFVVLARDLAGNMSQTIAEVSAATTP